jgi:nonsense-mediated mRNA decay protein 3
MRCCICGRETEKLQEGMCESCFSKEKAPFSIEKVIKLPVCKHCEKFYLGTWVEGTVEEIVAETVRYYLEPEEEFDTVEKVEDIPKNQMKIDFFPSEEKIEIAIELLAVRGPQEFTVRQQLITEILFEFVTCPACSRIRGGYYEAIVQIRREGIVLEEKKREEIIRAIKERIEPDEISRAVERKEGLDFYFVSKRTAKKMVNFLRSKYGGTIKESFEVYGKEKTRTTAVLRLPEYAEGMIVEYNDELFVVEDARGALDLRTLSGERKRFQWRNVDEKFKIIEKPLYEDVMITEITPEKVQVMSLTTYETRYLERNSIPQDINIKIGKEYRAIRRENDLTIWWSYGY